MWVCLECWAYNELVQSFSMGFPFFNQLGKIALWITGFELSRLLRLLGKSLSQWFLGRCARGTWVDMECWFYNELAQSFSASFPFLICLKKVSQDHYESPTEVIWRFGPTMRWLNFSVWVFPSWFVWKCMINHQPGFLVVLGLQWGGLVIQCGFPLLQSVGFASWIISEQSVRTLGTGWAGSSLRHGFPLFDSGWCNVEKKIFSEKSDLTQAYFSAACPTFWMLNCAWIRVIFYSLVVLEERIGVRRVSNAQIWAEAVLLVLKAVNS